MDYGALADLIRAAAVVHPQGDSVDLELIRSLRGMIALDRRRVASSGASLAGAQPNLDVGIRSGSTKPREHRKGDDGDSQIPQESVVADTESSNRELGELDNRIALKSVLQQITERADLSPGRQGDSSPVVSGQASAVNPGVMSVPVEALFPVGRVRAILREMSTVPIPAGEPDLEAVVGQIAAAEPIRELPRRLVSKLPHAIHWLFDAGPSMLPYSRDKQQLARTAPRLLGEDRTRIGDFIANPLKGVRPRGQVRWMELRWPARGSALVVVSDLGIGDSAGAEMGASGIWRPFLQEAAQRGVVTVSLNPYPQSRWPDIAADFEVSLTWDKETGVQELRRTKRFGSRLRDDGV